MIISGTAALRRRFFDILISLEDNSYLHDLQQFKHALAQRNAILKKGELTSKSSVFMPFEELMAFHGAKIMAQRNIFAEKISKEVNLLANDDKFHIQYRPHWKSDDLNSICQSLARSRHRDFQKGFTTEGIQLDDFEMILNGFAMRNFASSGQIRIHSLYLKMAEFNLSLAGGRKLIALIDDVTGELDKENEEKFFTLLDNAEQSFFTFTAPRQISLSQQLISLP
jgi:DNA replication and repair protein RecF